MRQRSVGLDLTEGNLTKKMIQYALPVMLSTALQQVYSLVDMMIVGQVLGSVGLASVSLGSQISHIMLMLSIGFTNATAVLISQAYGSRNKKAMKELMGTAFTVVALMAAVATAVGLIFGKSLLGVINTPAEAFKGASQYLFYSCLGFVFMFGYNVIAAVYRGIGDSTRPLLFVAVFHWGPAGASIATSLSQAVSFVVSLSYLYKKREDLGFDFKLRSFRILKDSLIPILKLGIPGSITMAAIQFSFMVVSANINKYGVDPAAAFAVGQRVDGLPGIVGNAVGSAMGVVVGQNFGAGKFDRIEKGSRVALVISGTVSAIFAAIFLIFPRQVFSIFTKDEATLALARTVMTGLVIAHPFNVMMNAYRGVVQGVGNAGLEMAMGIFDGVVLRIALAYFFGTVLGLGFFGFVIGYAGAAVGTGVPSMIYYLSRRWKKRKVLVKASDEAEAEEAE